MSNEIKPNQTENDLRQLIDQLSVDQVRFVVARQEHNTDKAAAESLSIPPQTVKDWKVRGAPIDEAVRAMATDGLTVAVKMRRRNLAKAMLVKVAGLDSNDERVRQGVSTEIIEWEMGKAVQPISGVKYVNLFADGEPVPLPVSRGAKQSMDDAS